MGITRLISFAENPPDDASASNFGIARTALPILDLEVPSLTQAWFLCEVIDRYIERGEVVAVQGRPGIESAGIALAIYWIWRGRGKVDATAAQEYVRDIEGGSAQSLGQELFLERFAELMLSPVARAVSLRANHAEAKIGL